MRLRAHHFRAAGAPVDRPKGQHTERGQAAMNPGPSTRVRRAASSGHWRDPTRVDDPGTPAVLPDPHPAR